MTQAEKESLQTHLHLWSHYNILYWTVFTISTIGFLISGILILLFSMEFYFNPSELVLALVLLFIAIFSMFFFKITANFHTYRLYHQQKVNQISESTKMEYLPEIARLGKTKFAKTRGFVATSILYYLIFAVSIYFAIFLNIMEVQADWLFVTLLFVPIAVLFAFFIVWIIFVAKWNIKDKLDLS